MARNLEVMVEDWVGSPPTVYFELKKAVEDPDSSFKDFSRIINSDPSLVGRLLRIVNSPFYGFNSRVETVQHALTIVGLDQLTELVLATTVLSQFKDIPADCVNMEDFWEHSVACGVGARMLGYYKKESELDRYYVEGILHDLGSLAIYKKTPEKAKKCFELGAERNIPLYQAEKEVLGFTHADVGAFLFKAWSLPPRLVEVVRAHHEPETAGEFAGEARIVHAANLIAYHLKLGSSGEQHPPPLDRNIWKQLDLPASIHNTLQEDLPPRVQEAIELFTGEP